MKRLILLLIFISCLLYGFEPASEEYMEHQDFSTENYTETLDNSNAFVNINNTTYVDTNILKKVIKALVYQNMQIYLKNYYINNSFKQLFNQQLKHTLEDNQSILKNHIVHILNENNETSINSNKNLNKLNFNITKLFNKELDNIFDLNSDFVDKIDSHSVKILEKNVNKLFNSSDNYIQKLIETTIDNLLKEKKKELFKNDSIFMNALMNKITQKIDEEIKNKKLQYQPIIQKNDGINNTKKYDELKEYLDRHIAKRTAKYENFNRNNFDTTNNEVVELEQYKQIDTFDFLNNIKTWNSYLVDFKYGVGKYESTQLVYSVILIIVIILILVFLFKSILDKIMVSILIIVMYYFWYTIVFQTNVNIISSHKKQNQIISDRINKLNNKLYMFITKTDNFNNDINITFNDYNKKFNFIDIQMRSLFIKKKSKNGKGFILVPKCRGGSIDVEIK